MDIIIWIIFGALAGWIASIIMKTNAQQGAIGNIVTGIVGAFIGGFIFRALTDNDLTRFSFTSLLVAIIGAVILIAIMRAIRGGARHA